MTNYQASNETDDSEGMWLVRMPGGGVRAVSLEQLDEAYQNDWITGDAEILEEGSSEWRKLSEIIGGDEPAAPPPPPPPVAQARPAYSTAPVAPPQPSYSQPAPAAYGAQAQQVQRNQGYGYPGAPSVPPSMPAPAASRPQISAQPSQYPYGPSVAPSAPKSTAPVASDIYNLDLSLDGSPFKKKSKKGIFIAAALLVVGGVGVAVASSSESAPTPVAAVATPAPVTPPAAAKSMLPSEPEATEKPKPAPETRLNDDTKRALAEADKKRDKAMSEKKKAKGAARAASSSRKRSGGERSVIGKGGDKHDPLNGSL